MADVYEKSLELHEKSKGKLSVVSKVKVENRDDLSLAYSPGVAEPCRKICANKEDVYKYTSKGNLVAVVTDGTAVLGLGDIGPEAALPVMEGKCVLFKEFGDVDAIPICLDTKDTEEIIRTVKLIAPGLGGINLEDISAHRCIDIETRLKEELDIPVFHDDQHGTAIVVAAGLINALKVVNKKVEDIKVVVNGAGAAIVGTGRSDYPNQINNVLVFPGLFKGALRAKSKKITEEMKIAAAEGLASLIKPEELRKDYIIPDAFDKRVAEAVASAVEKLAKEQGICRG